ncbi:MEGF10_11 [Mytilus edulis]|uniref:MEGF10_11 n=1 Tax=Mytilus edulis TaxID=6550 RepID=A0A8S3UFK7_MYTED|nr:MEGF10_11 [Mytilus edulis]
MFLCNKYLSECPIGHHSNGVKCKKCNDDQYGRKCADICRCSTNERCDHVSGCVAKYDRTDTTVTLRNYSSVTHATDRTDITATNEIYFSGSQVTAMTPREIVLLVVLLFLGLLMCLGMMYIFRIKKGMIFKIAPRTKNELKSFTITHQQTEEGSECIYNEIDESAIPETLTPLAFRTQLHNSYSDMLPLALGTQLHNPYLDMLGVKNSPCNISNNKEHYYSDGYLRPDTIAQHQQINTMLENQGTIFFNKDKVSGQEHNRHFYEQPVYAGIFRSVDYDRHSPKDVQNQTYVSMYVQNPIDYGRHSSKDVQNQTYVSMNVQNPIHPANVQLENINPKLATCTSKRWSI